MDWAEIVWNLFHTAEFNQHTHTHSIRDIFYLPDENTCWNNNKWQVSFWPLQERLYSYQQRWWEWQKCIRWDILTQLGFAYVLLALVLSLQRRVFPWGCKVFVRMLHVVTISFGDWFGLNAFSTLCFSFDCATSKNKKNQEVMGKFFNTWVNINIKFIFCNHTILHCQRII